MGLLDEAIREHLELKRRRGADPEDIAKQEHDALGPVRREPELPAAAEAPPRAEPDHPELHEEDAPEVAEDVSRPLVDSVPEEPLTPPESAGTGQSTEEWSFDDEDAEAAPAESHAEEAIEGEDVLEETPDFLQETPEHERLWFEQRPPRDFDFDG